MTPTAGYLRIGELARRTGVSPEVLRAWELRYGLLRPDRSPGGFRLYSDLDERRVRRAKALIETGLSAAEAARRALQDAVPAAAGSPRGLLDELRDGLRRALDAFDGESAHQVLDGLLATFSVEVVLDEVVLVYLRELGERWERGEISVAQEHFASNLLRGRLLALARDWDATHGPGLVLACPPGEQHDLALIAFGIVAARHGWRITFLGGDTPFETLVDAARSSRPSLVVLSVSTPEAVDRHAEEIERLAAVAPVAVGGRAEPERVRAAGATPLVGGPVEAARALSAAR